MRFEPGEEERYSLKPGDVLVCEGGEPGGAAVCRDAHSDMRFQKAIHRVRCEDAVLPDWVVTVLEAHASSGALSKYFTGSGIAHLTGVSLARVPVPLPPIVEQREIVRRADQLLVLADRLEQRISAASKSTQRSSQAVLGKAYRGELALEGIASNRQ
jgi:type I restriction enzyme S subunit